MKYVSNICQAVEQIFSNNIPFLERLCSVSFYVDIVVVMLNQLLDFNFHCSSSKHMFFIKRF